MKYQVSWDSDAFRHLLRQWNAAGKPHAATIAFDEVETALRTDAHLCGESRDGNRRILLVQPIGVIFEARQAAGEAMILDAWLFSGQSR